MFCGKDLAKLHTVFTVFNKQMIIYMIKKQKTNERKQHEMMGLPQIIK